MPIRLAKEGAEATDMRITVKTTKKARTKLMPGTVWVEEVPISEQRSKGGLIMVQHDPEKKFDRLCYGIVRGCAPQYKDLHGNVLPKGQVEDWPLLPGSLCCFKKHQVWLPPEDADRMVIVNGFDITQWWAPGDFETVEETEK